MRVTPRLLTILASADPAPTCTGGIGGVTEEPLYLTESRRNAGQWTLGEAMGYAVAPATLTELQGSAAQPDGSYLTRNVERRWLNAVDGWAVSMDLPDAPPPPPPPIG